MTKNEAILARNDAIHDAVMFIDKHDLCTYKTMYDPILRHKSFFLCKCTVERLKALIDADSTMLRHFQKGLLTVDPAPFKKNARLGFERKYRGC